MHERKQEQEILPESEDTFKKGNIYTKNHKFVPKQIEVLFKDPLLYTLMTTASRHWKNQITIRCS